MDSLTHRLKRSAVIVTGLSCLLNVYLIAVWLYAFNTEDNFRTGKLLYRKLIPVDYQGFVFFLMLLIFLSFIYLVRWIEQQRLIKILLLVFQSIALFLMVLSIDYAP